MCKVQCGKCGKVTDTGGVVLCAIVGKLKADSEFNPRGWGGACPRCGIAYSEENPPRLTLCRIGEGMYEKRRQQLDEGERIRRMNPGFAEKIEAHNKKVRARYVDRDNR